MCLSPTSKYSSTTPFCHSQSGEVSAGLVLPHWLCAAHVLQAESSVPSANLGEHVVPPQIWEH